MLNATQHLCVNCNTLTLLHKWRTLPAHTLHTSLWASVVWRRLCLPLAGLVSSRGTSSGARSAAARSTWASARGRGRTTCTQSRPRRRCSTCSRRRGLELTCRGRPNSKKLLTLPRPSLEAPRLWSSDRTPKKPPPRLQLKPSRARGEEAGRKKSDWISLNEAPALDIKKFI